MKHLYFVRHGLSIMNKQNIWSGVTDTPLAPEGITQCHAAGKELRGKGIDCIVSSPVRRAHDTAKIIAEEIGYDPAKIILNDRLAERDFGPLEGAPYEPERYDLNATKGVEHSDDLVARVAKGAEFLHGLKADTVLVVAHGSVGRALRSVVQEGTPFHSSEKFGNAQVVKLL